MATPLVITSSLVMFMILITNFMMINVCFSEPTCQPTYPPNAVPVANEDVDMLQFPLNLEYLEAEFYLFAALGYGLDVVAPQQAMGGPPPIGARKANLDFPVQDIIKEFAYQEVGHLRAIKSTVGGFPRPLMDLSSKNFAKLFDEAFGYKLLPPFDPYRDSLSYMLGSYVIPYMGLVGYVGTNPNLIGYKSKMLLAGLLGVEGGQDAVIRTYLYERLNETVKPYNITVAEFTIRISELRNKLAMCGIKDEGIIVPLELGAENRTTSNVLSANTDSLSYSRIPAEILRVLYDSGDESMPGGFYPMGGNGKIARGFLK
ncbi:ferritin-like catalase Nec2 [Cornus florida]|uniref:ferritin-like catalase Nec2 n=1 Tax=Cornus florida TaxID=4283 RepID=UPI0028963B51|nr:ferritin-like catalase Nec2 [Cornus florida]